MKTARLISLLCALGTVAFAAAPVFSQPWGTSAQSSDIAFSPDYSLFSAKAGTIAAGGVYRGAKISGRELIVRETFVYGSSNEGVAGWYVTQDMEAIGKTNTNRFTADAKRWGIAYGKALSSYNDSTSGMYFEHTDAGDGFLVKNASIAILAKVKTDAYGIYMVRRQGDLTWTYTGQYAKVKGGSESATATTGAVILEKPMGKSLSARASVGLTSQSMHSTNTLKTVINGAITYRPVDWFTMELGGTLAPSGVPVAGSSLSGAGCYSIYFPASDGLVGELKDGTVGAFTFRAVISIPVK